MDVRQPKYSVSDQVIFHNPRYHFARNGQAAVVKDVRPPRDWVRGMPVYTVVFVKDDGQLGVGEDELRLLPT